MSGGGARFASEASEGAGKRLRIFAVRHTKIMVYAHVASGAGDPQGWVAADRPAGKS